MSFITIHKSLKNGLVKKSTSKSDGMSRKRVELNILTRSRFVLF